MRILKKEGEERKEARGKTWGRVIELPGGAGVGTGAEVVRA